MRHIHPRQYMILTVLYTIGTSLLIIPSLLATAVEHDAWLGAVFTAVFNMLYVFVYVLLLQRFPGLSLVQIAEKLLGKWLGSVVAWLYISFFLLLAVLLLQFLGQFIHTSILPSTPVWFIYFTFMIVIVIGLAYGVEAYGRSAELFFPIVLLFLGLIMIALVFEIDVSRMRPIGERGMSPILLSGLKMSTFQEQICLMMLAPLVANKGKQTAARALVVGTAIGLLVLIAITLLTILILGSYNTAHFVYPVYVLVKKISIGDFFQRIEILMIAIWFLTVFVKIVVTMHAGLIGMTQTLNLKSCKPLILPVGLLIAIYAMIVFPNTATFFEFGRESWFSYALSFIFVLPVSFLIVDIVKRFVGSLFKHEVSE
ncbi:germination protein [Paenibacillus montaniterrae]|uniref:Germination protein n=1 Tax=Paenibacillus montaniterrae TaxID=429341 RepID=A0A920CU92_9BACL|nr:endospore germination permease [Paenibacillus montaniterrae]GIP16762.1 germination protein [Paenibacillus montaniterrae]